MKCDFCDNKATVFLTQLVEGQMRKVCLCEPCAKERGVMDPTGFSMADLLFGGATIAQTAPFTPVSQPPGVRRCPACGFTMEDLKKVRRFGCAECYNTFAEELEPMLRTMHKGATHIGKVPQGLMARQLRDQRLEELQSRLDQAIASESYEEAAGIRDEIRNLTESKA